MRLALGFALLFIISSLLLVGLLWWGTADYLDRETAAVIRADAQSIEDDVTFRGVGGAAAMLNERDGQAPDGRAVFMLANPALKAIAGNLTAWPQSLPVKPG
ncbi:MAG TPA: hypothetical protein VME45_07020, partial [Stellaceae bacterium]|nr:hypothetical protein [Stellaceae bacterium]